MTITVKETNQGFWSTADATLASALNVDIDDILILVVYNEKGGSTVTTTSVTSDHLTWTKYVEEVASGQQTISVWWAHATSNQVSEDFTIQLSEATDDSFFLLLSASGINTTSPFDASSPFYAHNEGPSNAVMEVAGVSTAVANTLEFWVYGSYSLITTGVPAGFTEYATADNEDGSRFAVGKGGYLINSSTVSSVTRTGTSPNSVQHWQLISFALQATGEIPPFVVDITDDAQLVGVLTVPPLEGNLEDGGSDLLGAITIGDVPPRSQQMVICIGV
jgi:hypothetical protein